MILRPVLVAIPRSGPDRSPEQVKAQRVGSREALRQCARLCGAPEDGWTKSADNVPQPNAGFHWSVSHKRRWAAAVVSDEPVGIDIERIEPRPSDLHDALGAATEWDLLGDRSWHAFFRLWTAKEATLKANGVGIGQLLACTLAAVPDEHHLALVYGGKAWHVEHYYHDDHIAAVTCAVDAAQWQIGE